MAKRKVESAGELKAEPSVELLPNPAFYAAKATAAECKVNNQFLDQVKRQVQGGENPHDDFRHSALGHDLDKHFNQSLENFQSAGDYTWLQKASAAAMTSNDNQDVKLRWFLLLSDEAAPYRKFWGYYADKHFAEFSPADFEQLSQIATQLIKRYEVLTAGFSKALAVAPDDGWAESVAFSTAKSLSLVELFLVARPDENICLLLVAGPSGAGKDELLRFLYTDPLKDDPEPAMLFSEMQGFCCHKLAGLFCDKPGESHWPTAVSGSFGYYKNFIGHLDPTGAFWACQRHRYEKGFNPIMMSFLRHHGSRLQTVDFSIINNLNPDTFSARDPRKLRKLPNGDKGYFLSPTTGIRSKAELTELFRLADHYKNLKLHIHYVQLEGGKPDPTEECDLKFITDLWNKSSGNVRLSSAVRLASSSKKIMFTESYLQPLADNLLTPYTA